MKNKEYYAFFFFVGRQDDKEESGVSIKEPCISF